LNDCGKAGCSRNQSLRSWFKGRATRERSDVEISPC
jgi:hypothetical protein